MRRYVICVVDGWIETTDHRHVLHIDHLDRTIYVSGQASAADLLNAVDSLASEEKFLCLNSVSPAPLIPVSL